MNKQTLLDYCVLFVESRYVNSWELIKLIYDDEISLSTTFLDAYILEAYMICINRGLDRKLLGEPIVLAFPHLTKTISLICNYETFSVEEPSKRSCGKLQQTNNLSRHNQSCK